MATKSNYWLERRAVKRLAASEERGTIGISRVLSVYREALRNINTEISRVYANYSTKKGIDLTQLSKVIEGSDRARFIASVKENMKKLGFTPSKLFDDRYLYRLSRLDALKQQIYWEIAAVAPKERDISGEVYRDVLNSTYKNTSADNMRANGLTPAFATLDRGVANEILNNKWLGSNYSTRIWGSVNGYARKISIMVGAAIVSGTGYDNTYRQLRDQFGASEYSAARLMRTEINYFHNAAELESYIDQGIEYYQYAAILDNRTSRVCEDQNGNQFAVADAVVGVNYPPLHPNCRSTTIAIFPEEYGKKFVGKKNIQVKSAEEPTTDVPTPPPLQTVQQIQAANNLAPAPNQYTVDELSSIKTYQQNESYRIINNYLRNGQDSGVRADFTFANGQNVADIIYNVDNAIANSRVKEAATIYRGLDIDTPSAIEVGNVLTEKGYSSFTRDQKTAEIFAGSRASRGTIPAVIELDIDKGTKALATGDLTGLYKSEKEMLLQRGLSLRVDSVTTRGDVLVIKVSRQ